MDQPGVFFSDNFGSDADGASTSGKDDNQSVKKRFKEFLRQFNEDGFSFKYRDELRRLYSLGQYWVEVNVEDLASFDEPLADKLYKNPTETVPLFEEAATEVADEVTNPRPEGEEEVEKIQVKLHSEAHAASLRDLGSESVSRLVKIPGIVIAASGVRAKAHRISVQCRSCRTVVPNIDIKPGLEG